MQGRRPATRKPADRVKERAWQQGTSHKWLKRTGENKNSVNSVSSLGEEKHSTFS